MFILMYRRDGEVNKLNTFSPVFYYKDVTFILGTVIQY